MSTLLNLCFRRNTSEMDLTHEKWFSDSSLSDTELQEIEALAFQLLLPIGHPVLRRLRLTVADSRTTVPALRTLARLALPEPNGPVVLDLLEAASKSIERQVTTMSDEMVRLCDTYLLECLVLAAPVRSMLTASDALMLLNNSVKRCTRSCASILRSTAAHGPTEASNCGRPLRVVPAISRILHELVSYKAFWSRRGRESGDKPMQDLSKSFEKYIGEVNEVVLDEEVLDLIGLVMNRWCLDVALEPQDATALRFFPVFEQALASVLGFVMNILTFTSSFTIAIRKHLSSQTVLLHNVVLPLTLFLLDADERHNSSNSSATVCSLLRALSMVMFNVRVFRPWLLRTPDIIERICRYASHVANEATVVEIVAATTRLVVNAELMEGVSPLLSFVSQLNEQQQRDVSRKLSNPRERSAPTQIFCETYLSLRSLFVLKGAADRVSETIPSKTTIQRRKRNRRRRERNQSRYRSLQSKSSHAAVFQAQGQGDEDDTPVDDGSCSDMEYDDAVPTQESEVHSEINIVDAAPTKEPEVPNVLPPAQSKPVSSKDQLLARYRNLPSPPPGTPDRYLCALTHQVMQVPVLSPYGDVFDKASILGFLKESGNQCPITDNELYVTDLVVDQGLKRELDVVRFNYC